jgi:hypothetical protein
VTVRRLATVFALSAGAIALGISLYLLVAQPSIGKDWLGGWVNDMGTGSPFTFPGAPTVLGLFGIVFSAAIFFSAWLLARRFVAGALTALGLDMLALVLIAICPDPKRGVFIWAAPGLLLAGVGFLMGMHQEKVQEPDGYAEF